MNNFERKLWGVISGNWGLQNSSVKYNWEQSYCWICCLGVAIMSRVREGTSKVFYFQFCAHILIHSHPAGAHVSISYVDTDVMHCLSNTKLPCSEIISSFKHILISLRLKSLCMLFHHQRPHQGSEHIQFHYLISTGSSSKLSLTYQSHLKPISYVNNISKIFL